jgi:hypothetical protein
VLNPSPSYAEFSVFVNGVHPLEQYTPCVKIIKTIDAHDIAFLDVLYVGSNTGTTQGRSRHKWAYLKEQTPIQIVFGQKPNYMDAFVGYISSYELIKTGKDIGMGERTTTTVRYTITGASWVMQSTNNIAWKHTSPSTIAATIASKNGFRSIVHVYQAAIDYRLQNVSDFKFLAKLADEIGYRFYVDNTDLYFVNPRLMLQRNNSRNIPTFWSNNAPGVYDTIREFRPIVGSTTPDGGIVANRNIVGLNPSTQQITQATQLANVTDIAGNPLADYITKFYNDAPAESYFEAQQKVIADAYRNIYWNTAQSTLFGDARIQPNGLVNLIGKALTPDESGVWLVDTAIHELHKQPPGGNKYQNTYTVDAKLVRDQIYTANTTEVSTLQDITRAVPAKLTGSKWISSNIGASIYAT